MLNDLAALFASEPALFAVSVFLLGLVVGSFLNVVIYRLPIILEREWQSQAAEVLSADAAAPVSAPSPTLTPAPPARFTLSTPRSACPNCKAPIKAWQNIPVVSWLALRGRCAACKTRISPRYPLVELTTAVLSAWVAWHFGFGWPAACALLVTWSLIALTGIDIDHQLLPDNITLPLMWAGLVAAVALGPVAGAALPVSVRDAVIGAAAGYLSLWLVPCVQAGDGQGRHGLW
jgi:leader peptidase (prepilin peptidase) / N-methyltransferase